jgi:hypothetical protein
MDLTDDDRKKLKKIILYYGVQFDTEGVRIALTAAVREIDAKGVNK